MVKTLVVERGEGRERIPFLRGILTRSLRDAGLSFEEAYAVASSVREELSETTEITADDLRDSVLKHISRYGPAIVQRYQNTSAIPGTILVRDGKGHTTQFSREQHRRVLESSGLSYEESTAVVATIFTHLMNKGVTDIRSRQLGVLTYRYLRFAMGPEVAERYLVLVRFLRRERPVVLLFGGAPGTGKSAVATEVAHRLEIVRTQSTDLLREVMRMMVPERLMPVLHCSSYDAWRALPSDPKAGIDAESLLVDGYRAQAELLSVPCEAVIKRSLHEHTSLILEGVHVQHALTEKIPEGSDAIVIPVLLAVLSPEKLRDRFRGRGKQIDDRRAERYLENFDSIWSLQSYLLSEADRWGIPIIVNNYREQVIREVMATIMDSLSDQITVQPSEVFI